jgi:hypothetical protein
MSGRRDDVFDPTTRPTSPGRVVGGVPAEIWVVGRASAALAPVRFCTPNVCVNSQKPGTESDSVPSSSPDCPRGDRSDSPSTPVTLRRAPLTRYGVRTRARLASPARHPRQPRASGLLKLASIRQFSQVNTGMPVCQSCVPARFSKLNPNCSAVIRALGN